MERIRLAKPTRRILALAVIQEGRKLSRFAGGDPRDGGSPAGGDLQCYYLLLLLCHLTAFGTRINAGDFFKWKNALKTRDIPALINPSPPTHQLGLQSPLSAIS
jgi:hypothetical protein